MPAHVGTPTPGFGYEAGDPYADFLPPAVEVREQDGEASLRAVVIVSEATRKGTGRSGQEYVDPLLVLSGAEYAAMSFADLHERICSALRGSRPRAVAEVWREGRGRLVFENGSFEEIGEE